MRTKEKNKGNYEVNRKRGQENEIIGAKKKKKRRQIIGAKTANAGGYNKMMPPANMPAGKICPQENFTQKNSEMLTSTSLKNPRTQTRVKRATNQNNVAT